MPSRGSRHLDRLERFAPIQHVLGAVARCSMLIRRPHSELPTASDLAPFLCILAGTGTIRHETNGEPGRPVPPGTAATAETSSAVDRRHYSEAWRDSRSDRWCIRVPLVLVPCASVAAVALEAGINSNLLFAWRGMHLSAQERPRTPAPSDPSPMLLPVTIETAPVAAFPAPTVAAPRQAAGTIEIDVAGVRLRRRGAVDEASVRHVLQTLKALT